ncbi:MAG: hypothetical protein KA270_00935 [Saprospiraceae bacterium]|nr:hypothetical protein [Saprospiraceae bacterium]MBP6565694.1 hypothetical protein [Saprospiraceae bacterium]
MSYPVEILPNKEYKQITCVLLPYRLTRFTNTKDILDDTGLIMQSYIVSPKEGILDLSLSLLGIFEFEHNQISLLDLGKTKYNQYCAPNETVDIPQMDIDYIINLERSWWSISIQKIMEQNYTCFYKETEIKFMPVITHTPMMWNYWHFSLTWAISNFDIDSIASTNQKNRFKEIISSTARSSIQQYSMSGEIPFDIIDEKEYKS